MWPPRISNLPSSFSKEDCQPWFSVASLDAFQYRLMLSMVFGIKEVTIGVKESTCWDLANFEIETRTVLTFTEVIFLLIRIHMMESNVLHIAIASIA